MANPNTARAYATALRAVQSEFGPAAALGVLEGEAGVDAVAAWFARTWRQRSPSTVNLRLGALASACRWWRDQG
ncbi:MAG: site-specific integrase, partial [Candidatus Dormibacteraeota bacterium]|nr:site-specific integrase [Candidatus Dormibacteraeota bacterium]